MDNKAKLLREANFGLGLLKILLAAFLLIIPAIFLWTQFNKEWPEEKEIKPQVYTPKVKLSVAPSINRLSRDPNKEQLLYGQELIRNTAYYIGFNGTKKQITNGLNCQNCHLDAGQKPWGNNYLGVASSYPQIRKRSNKMTDVYGRINGCLSRSLNGQTLDSTDTEMKAMAAYINWLGQDIPKGYKAKGAKVYPIDFLDRAASPENGKRVYETKCMVCHQQNGEGILSENKRSYTYPPLWGKHSYNDGAGLYRLSKFAGYAKMNMPFGVTHENPLLSDEEAWDLAAYVNSMPRPEKDKSNDWPNLADKPIDHPFGPYSDPFSEEQHKYGPYKPIKEWYENQNIR